MLSVLHLDIAANGPRITKSAGIVICDSHGNPLVTVIEHQPGVEVVTTCNDPEFNQQLRTLGLGTLIVPEAPQLLLAGPPPSDYRPFRG